MRSGEWGARVADASKVFRPEGPGPFPVALILHGCGGKTPFLEAYARVAVEAGWAAVVVDSFAPRGISPLRAKLTVCTGTALRGLERSGDIFAMRLDLRDRVAFHQRQGQGLVVVVGQHVTGHVVGHDADRARRSCD